MESEKIRKGLIYLVMTFLFFVIILQLMYIHSQLNVTRELIMKKGINAESVAARVGENQNRLRIYPIIVNLKLCNKITQSVSDMSNLLQPIVFRDIQVLPYVCDRSIQNVQVYYTKIGILVLNPNQGSDRLYEDVKNDFVHYIIIREQLYGIKTNDTIKQKVMEYFQNTDKEDIYDELYNNHLFVLEPLLNHQVVNDQLKENCRFLLFPFIGKLNKKSESQFLIDINIELAPSVISNQSPMHIIGYRTI